MIDNNHTIVLKNKSEYFKLLKFNYGKDGSIYVSCPYHESRDAIVVLSTINYSKNEVDITLEETIKNASVDDDLKALKLSHHKSGLIQVSGQGIVSGLNEDGSLKGIGIQSFPLDNPAPGPTFIVSIYGYEKFKSVENHKRDFRIFEINDLIHDDQIQSLVIEGYCFPEKFKRFIKTDNHGNKIINLIHPSGITIPLKVCLPKANVTCQSFFGFDLYFEKGMEYQISPSYNISSSTGNIRLNDKNEKLGDSVSIMFPRQNLQTKENLNYRAD